MKLDEETINNISELGRQMSDTTILMHEAIAKKAGLSGTDHKYLGLLIKQGAMTAGELSRLTGLTTGAVTGLIDRLENRQLVNRAFDKKDRRKVMIVPNTEQAMELLGGIFAELQSNMLQLFATLTMEETIIIERYLRSAIEVMRDFTDTLQASDNK